MVCNKWYIICLAVFIIGCHQPNIPHSVCDSLVYIDPIESTVCVPTTIDCLIKSLIIASKHGDVIEAYQVGSLLGTNCGLINNHPIQEFMHTYGDYVYAHTITENITTYGYIFTCGTSEVAFVWEPTYSIESKLVFHYHGVSYIIEPTQSVKVVRLS